MDEKKALVEAAGEEEARLPVIAELPVSESWKRTFALLAEAEPIRWGLAPVFENHDVIRRHPRLQMNLLAFIFGPLYYVAKGMPKKAATLFVTYFSFALLLSMVLPAALVDAVGVGLCVLFSMNANVDYYRKKVLEEDFWW